MENILVNNEEDNEYDGLAHHAVQSLRMAIRDTRSDRSGSTLDVVAWVINEELDGAEVKALIAHLKNITE